VTAAGTGKSDTDPTVPQIEEFPSAGGSAAVKDGPDIPGVVECHAFAWSLTFLARDVSAMLTVAVGLDFLAAEEVDDDTGCLEIGAAFPPEAVHSLRDAGL
jgi:hypothetical protein